MEYIDCLCGKRIKKSFYLTHCKSQIHQQFLNTGKPYESIIDQQYAIGDWRRYRHSKMKCLNEFFKRKRLEKKSMDIENIY